MTDQKTPTDFSSMTGLDLANYLRGLDLDSLRSDIENLRTDVDADLESIRESIASLRGDVDDLRDTITQLKARPVGLGDLDESGRARVAALNAARNAKEEKAAACARGRDEALAEVEGRLQTYADDAEYLGGVYAPAYRIAVAKVRELREGSES